MKFSYKKVFLLGFGFFAVSITWSVYNSFMPKILSTFTANAALIGFIMTIDNYLALFIQPLVGAYSDTHMTRFGRRMPFLLAGMPLAALFLFLIPQYWNFASLVVFLVLMNLSMSIFRSPVISLMPDLTPLELRSKSNSIINLMGGIGAVIAYFIGAILWDKNHAFPFYLSGALVLISLIILFININEKRDSIYINDEEETSSVSFMENVKIIFSSPKQHKSLITLLEAICCYFIAYQGIEAFFSLYGEKYLGITVSQAAMSFTFISLSFLIFAFPAGIIGTKLGKKKTMVYGVSGLLLSFFIIAFIKSILIIRVLFIFCGFFWALININSYPFVVQMADKSTIGAYTGFYYTASSIAAILSPVLLGAIINAVSYRYMFFYAVIFMIVSLILLLNVKDSGN